MNLHNYIEKLRAKPVRERERIAVIWTAIGFALIFVIWIVSFKEMNKPTEVPVDQTSANLNDLKDNFQTGKDSIQDMMEDLPSQVGTDSGAENVPSNPGTDSNATSAASANSGTNAGDTNNPVENNDQNKNSVPALP